jgi:hypothetical protein
LGGKFRLPIIDNFNLNIRSLILPPFTVTDEFGLSLNLNGRIETGDDLFLNPNNFDSVKEHDLKIKLTIYKRHIDDDFSDDVSRILRSFKLED